MATPGNHASRQATALLPSVLGASAGVPNGGVADADAIMPVLEIVGPMNNCGGTAVLLDESWVLTASHCLASLAPRLWLRSPRLGARRIEVAEIHWQSGDSWRAGDGALPPDAGRYTGDMDQLALMKLAIDVRDAGLVRCDLIANLRLNKGDVLYFAGFGEDDVGNYSLAGLARVAAMRYAGLGTNWRGTVERDPDLPHSGMPHPGDSGAPIFRWDVPDPRNPIHLVGIHSGRTRDAEGREVGEFLPLNPAALSWIQKTTGIVPVDVAPGADRSLRQLRMTPSTNHFILRNRFTCLYLQDESSLDNASDDMEWFLVDVFSPSHRLSNCTPFQISGGLLEIVCDGAQLSINLACESGKRWLSGTAVDGSKWYVYRLADAPLSSGNPPIRRIRIEVYSTNGLNTPPSLSNIVDGQSLGEDTTIVDFCFSSSGAADKVLRDCQMDQDDQGSGYERKREH